LPASLYANIAVNVGLNLREGQDLQIVGFMPQIEFVGARRVEYLLDDQELLRPALMSWLA
jgi:leucyl aminopeptidase (aminopeptidase T)